MPARPDSELGTITVDDVPVPRVNIELSDPPTKLQLVNAPAEVRKILALIRLHNHPLGTVVLDGASDLTWQTHARAVWSAMRQPVNAHLAADGLPTTTDVNSLCVTTPLVPECARRRAAVLASAPRITVIVATRERPNDLRACLDSLLQLDYPAYEVLVVDNDPASDNTARLINEHFAARVRYLREDRRGLAWAHNCGLKEVQTDLVAFTDDDVVVDRHWLTGIAEGFAADADVACVTGLILPEQLDTPAQLLLHHHCGFGNNGFVQRVYDMGHNRPDDPVFPLTAGKVGSGPNMAFATRELRRQGGFDPALGVGTKTYGCDDTAAFVRTVLRHRLVYQPAAIVWHRHHREMVELRKQPPNGVSMGAFLTSVMLHEARMWAPLMRRVPAGIAAVFRSSSPRPVSPFVGLPRKTERLEKLSILYGVIRYVESHWRVRKLSGPQDKIVIRRRADLGALVKGIGHRRIR